MTKHFPITGAPDASTGPHRSEDADVPQVLNQSGAGLPLPCWHEPSNLTGEAGAPSTLPNYSEKPKCAECGRSLSVCICDPDDVVDWDRHEAEQRVFESLRRIDWFKTGWALAERSALR